MSKNTSRETNNNYQEIGQIHQLASSLAVLVFEVPVSVPLSGIELYKQFVAANLGTLISQRLLENEDKIRYFGVIESPPSLLITGTRISLYRLSEAWRNRLLKAPENTKLLTYGMLEGLKMESIPQRSKIALSDLVMMAVSDLSNQSLLAHSITVQQHLVAKCDEMNIPSTSAIEYCLSQLQKQKKIYYHNGGFRMEIQPKNGTVVTQEKRPRKSCPPPNSVNYEITDYKTRRQSEGVKTVPKGKEKSNFFSASFRKLRQTMRRKKNASQNNTLLTVQKQSSDSGVDLSKSINQSVTSNSSQVMSPQSESSGISPPTVTEERAYEMGYLNHRERQSKRMAKISKYNDVGMSDVESVASSRMSSRIKQKPKPRNGQRRRRSKSKGDKYTSSTSKSSSRPTSEDVKSYRGGFNESTTPSVFGAASEAAQSRGDSTVMLDTEVCGFMDNTIQEPQIDTIQENNESITINVTDDAGNSIEELTFEPTPVKSPSTPRISAKTLPREVRLFNDINGKLPRSISATEQLKLSSPPIRRRDLKPAEAYSRSRTPNSIYLVADEIRRKHENLKNAQKRCTSIPVCLTGNKAFTESNEFKEEYQKYNAAVIKQPAFINGNKETPKQTASTPKAPVRTTIKARNTKSSSTLESNLSPIRSITPAPRSSSQLRPVKAPRSRSAVPQQMKEKTANHSLEMLEQLSLTREEWIDYFRTKKLPPLAEIELEKLQQKRTNNSCSTQHANFLNESRLVDTSYQI